MSRIGLVLTYHFLFRTRITLYLLTSRKKSTSFTFIVHKFQYEQKPRTIGPVSLERCDRSHPLPISTKIVNVGKLLAIYRSLYDRLGWKPISLIPVKCRPPFLVSRAKTETARWFARQNNRLPKAGHRCKLFLVEISSVVDGDSNPPVRWWTPRYPQLQEDYE